MHGVEPGPTGDGRSEDRRPRSQLVAVRGHGRRTAGAVDLLQVSLVVCILTYVWRIQDLYPVLGTLKVPVLASVAAIGAFVVGTDGRRSLASIKHPITYLLFAFLGFGLLSIPTSIYDGQSFRFIFENFAKTFLITVILAASVRSTVDAKRFVAAMVVGGVIYAAYVQLNFQVGEGGRLADLLYYDANDLGMVLVSTIPLALYFVVRGRRVLHRILAGLAIGLFLLVIVKTGSRGAFVGLVAVSGYLLFGFRSVSKSMRTIAVVGGIATLLVFGSEQYWGMMRTLLNPQEDYNWTGESEGGRLETWRRGLGYMWDRPLTGVGIANFGIAEGTLSEMAERQQYGIGLKWGTAHNSFIQVGAEIGVLGLGVFLWLLVQGYRTARTMGRGPPARQRPSDASALGEAMAGSLVGYVVTAFFLSQAYAAYTLFLLGLIVGLWKVSRPTRSTRPSRMRRQPRPALVGAGPAGPSPRNL